MWIIGIPALALFPLHITDLLILRFYKVFVIFCIVMKLHSSYPPKNSLCSTCWLLCLRVILYQTEGFLTLWKRSQKRMRFRSLLSLAWSGEHWEDWKHSASQTLSITSFLIAHIQYSTHTMYIPYLGHTVYSTTISCCLTLTRKKDTPYVLRDLANFTYFTFASISVISPQLLCSYKLNSIKHKKRKKRKKVCTTDSHIQLSMPFSHITHKALITLKIF